MQSILPEQQHFEHPNLWTAILAHIPDEGKPLRDKLQQHWTTPGKEQAQIDSSGDVNVARWNQLCAELDKVSPVQCTSTELHVGVGVHAVGKHRPALLV